MKIKVCGMRETENIQELVALKPDYMGFIYYDKSPRYVGSLDAQYLNNLPKDVHKTAVFVNESAKRITKLIEQYNFTAIQLHGQESPEFCNQFIGKVQVLKAFGVDEQFDFEQLKPYAEVVDYFLFDTKTNQHGGSGKTFNWQVLSKYQLDVPFFLSGGLSMENLQHITKFKHPQFYGVDLNSKFEISPGLKDIARLEAAFNLLRQPITDEVRS